jgi:hypothetical protein
MDIRITDHGNIWVDGKQYIGLDRMNQLLQEKGAIDYDRIQSIVYDQLVKALGVPEITDDQFEEYCKKRNLCVVGAETLSQRYDEGYKAGSKDANARFNILDVQRHKDLEALRAAHANLKIEFVKRLYEGLGNWAKEHKIGYTADDFVLIETGIDAVKEVIQSQLTLNEMRRVFDSVKFKPDKPAGDGCGFVD